MFPKYMDPVTSTGGEKIPWCMLLSFSKMNVLLWHQDQVIHRYENLHCNTKSIYVYFYYIIIIIFVYIELSITAFQISYNA